VGWRSLTHSVPRFVDQGCYLKGRSLGTCGPRYLHSRAGDKNLAGGGLMQIEKGDRAGTSDGWPNDRIAYTAATERKAACTLAGRPSDN
jgi:hypothetical protein